MILFCQMDVTGRTEIDPAANTLTRNILQYVSDWKPEPVRAALYVGDTAGKRHLESSGFVIGNYAGEKLSPGQVLIVGPGGGGEIAKDKAAIAEWLKTGGSLLALGLDQHNADGLLPVLVAFKTTEYISAFFEPTGANSRLRGIGPADLHNRDPRNFALLASGVTTIGDGVIATANNTSITFCQLLPWQFDPTKQSNLKKTYRRSSVVVTRLLSNLGVVSSTPILARFNTPVDVAKSEKRWLDGLYLDQPEEWDDPYRFFRW
jgi:hypothetical protein